MSEQMFWPRHFEEWRPDLEAGGKIRTEDIANYAYPPWTKERYTPEGWMKAMHLMVELGIPIPHDEVQKVLVVDVRDFGAMPDV